MSSTYVSKRAVAKLSDDADPFVLLFNETCESNVFPQEPHWSCWFFGRLSAAIKKIIAGSYYYEGGCTKGARGRMIKPESDLAAWRTAFKTPASFHRSTVDLPIKRKYASTETSELLIRANAIKRMCDSVGSHAGFYLEKWFESSFFTFDLKNQEDLLAIDQLVNTRVEEAIGQQQGGNTMAYPWYLFDSPSFGYSENPIVLPVLPPKAINQHDLLKVTLRPYAQSPDYVTEAHLIVKQGKVLTDEAFKWACSNRQWHAGATDQIKGAMLSLAACRTEAAAMKGVDQNDIHLIAEPMVVSQLSPYIAEKYLKLGIGSVATRIKPESVAAAFGLIESGLVLTLHGDQLKELAFKADVEPEVQETLCF